MKKFFSLFLTPAIICACSTWDISKNIDQISKDVDKDHQQLKNTKSIAADNFITSVHGGLFTSHASKIKNTDPLPQVFYDSYKVDKTFVSLRDAADAITQLTSIPSDVDAETFKVTNSETSKFVRITQQKGNLINLLNVISTKYDVSWSYHDGTLEFNQYDTRTWIINAIPGDFKMQNNVNNLVGLQAQNQAPTNPLTISQGPSTGGGNGGGGLGGGSSASQNNSSQGQQNLSFNTDANIWTNLKETVKAMLTEKGKLSVSPADSTVTITDRPHVIRLVDRFIEHENAILGRQVKLEVRVLSVQLNNADNYGVNWQAIINGSQTKISIAGTAGFNAATGATSFAVSATSGDMTGSQAILSVLSTLYKTSTITNATVITHNNQPAPVQAARQTAYLASSQTTQVAQAGAQTTLTPGVITTGFNMNVLPKILPNDEINLQLTMNLSGLLGMGQASSNGSSIQLPDVETKSFMQKVSLRSGDTLVLSGYERNENALTENGVGSPSNWFFGGGLNAKKVKDVIVILITPQIITIK